MEKNKTELSLGMYLLHRRKVLIYTFLTEIIKIVSKLYIKYHCYYCPCSFYMDFQLQFFH